MCGIVGYCGQAREGQWGETFDLLTSLFVQSQIRGDHAAGYAAITSDYKGRSEHRVISAKAPIPAKTFVQTTAWRRLRHHRCCSLIAHCRLATTGPAEQNINNHPHGSNGDEYFMVHNGHIRNWQMIARRQELKMTSQCDSEVIIRLAEQVKHPAVGLTRALAICDGSMAVVLQDIYRSGVLWLVRNDGSPLWLLRLADDRQTFFASTRHILTQALSSVLGNDYLHCVDLLIPLAANHVHGLTPDGEFIALGE